MDLIYNVIFESPTSYLMLSVDMELFKLIPKDDMRDFFPVYTNSNIDLIRKL